MTSNLNFGLNALLAPVFLSLSFCFVSSVNAKEGLAIYYSFDETSGDIAHDGSGNGNDGKNFGATHVAGKIGSALQFNGVDNYVDCGNAEILTDLPSLTYEAWIYPKSAAPWKAIVTKTYPRLCLGSTGQQLFFDYKFDIDYDRAFSVDSHIIPLNEWSHVVATWFHGNANIYLNGKLVESGYTYGNGTPLSNAGFNQNIGRESWGGGGGYFNGIIDEVRIYDRVLAEEEIKQHYQSRDISPDKQNIEVKFEDVKKLIGKLKGTIKKEEKMFSLYSAYISEDTDLSQAVDKRTKELAAFSAQAEKALKEIPSLEAKDLKTEAGALKSAIRKIERNDDPGLRIVKSWKNLGVEPGRDNEFVVSQATSLETIMRDKVWNKPITGEVKLQMAANEYESAQLVVVPLVKELKGVKIKCTDLRSEKNILRDLFRGFRSKKISADNINIWPVGYLKINGQFWPDPLLRKESFDIDSKDQIVQPVWINVYAPEGTPPGNYMGHIIITSSNQEAKVKLAVKVWNFTLAREQHFIASYCTRPNQISQFYSATQNYRKTLPVEECRKYFDVFLNYRMTPDGFDESPYTPAHKFIRNLAYVDEIHNPDGSCSFDFSLGGENIEYCLDRGANINGINIGGMFTGGYFSEYNKVLTQYLKDATRFLKEKGWLNTVYLYAPDERQPEEFKRLNELIGLARKISPDLKMFMAASDSSKALIKEGIVDKMDVWCPYVTSLDSEETAKMRKDGKSIWFYANHMLFMPLPAIAPRIIPWIGWKYNVDGFLAWATDWWEGHNLNDVDEAGPKETWDPYPSFGGPKGALGDGYIIYPSLSKKIIHSTRLESARDGLEDWEYMYILRDKAEELKRKKPRGYEALVKEAENLLEIDATIVKSPTAYTNDPQKICKRREEIAHQIEKINRRLEND